MWNKAYVKCCTKSVWYNFVSPCKSKIYQISTVTVEQSHNILADNKIEADYCDCVLLRLPCETAIFSVDISRIGLTCFNDQHTNRLWTIYNIIIEHNYDKLLNLSSSNASLWVSVSHYIIPRDNNHGLIFRKHGVRLQNIGRIILLASVFALFSL